MKPKTNFLRLSLLILGLLLFFVSSCEKDNNINNWQQSVPLLSTNEVTDITSNSATSGGDITYDGGTPVDARGVCWSTNENPTIDDHKTEDGTDVGSFSSSITDLEPNTTYYLRAYSTNSVGTGYGSAVSFTTNEQQNVPVISTNDVTDITSNSAMSGGNITYDGGTTIDARGVCWSTHENPTIDDNTTEDGTGAGSFMSSITNLESNTTYFVRAYATNSEGIGYGEQMSFTTDAGEPQAGFTSCGGYDYNNNVSEYTYEGIICISDLIIDEANIDYTKIEFKYHFSAFFGEPIRKGHIRWIGENGASEIYTITVRAKVYNLDGTFTGYYHFYSPLFDDTENSWSYDVSGSPDWSEVFNSDADGLEFVSESTAKNLYVHGFYLDDFYPFEINSLQF